MTPVATANLGSRSDDVVLRGLLLLSEQVDAIGVQESGDRLHLIARFCKTTGWRVFFGDLDGSASVAILWNPKKGVVSQQATRPATEATDCGKCGAGPNKVKAKVWNKVRFHPKNGDESFVFINGHLPASLYCKCRKRLGKEMIGELADMFERREGRIRVVAVCDGNSFSWMPIWKPVRKTGAKQWVKFPTLRLRSIDQMWTLGVKRAKAKRFKKKFSDHRWVILQVF